MLFYLRLLSTLFIPLDHLFFLRYFLEIINYPSIYSPIKLTSDSPLFQAVRNETFS